MNTRGFTLMEVFVSLGVLGCASVAFFKFFDGFTRARSIEREQARAYVCSVQAMENLVKSPPSCGEPFAWSFTECESTLIRLTQVPGPASLLLADVQTNSFHTIHFRRLIQCKKS